MARKQQSFYPLYKTFDSQRAKNSMAYDSLKLDPACEFLRQVSGQTDHIPFKSGRRAENQAGGQLSFYSQPSLEGFKIM